MCQVGFSWNKKKVHAPYTQHKWGLSIVWSDLQHRHTVAARREPNPSKISKLADPETHTTLLQRVRAGGKTEIPAQVQWCVSLCCSRPLRRFRPSSCRGRGPRRRKAAATSWATSRRSVASPSPRQRRGNAIVRAQVVYQTWKDQKDGKASTPAVSDAYDYGYRGRSEYALDMPRPEFKFCPPREMTGVPVEITRACATFSGQMYDLLAPRRPRQDPVWKSNFTACSC